MADTADIIPLHRPDLDQAIRLIYAIKADFAVRCSTVQYRSMGYGTHIIKHLESLGFLLSTAWNVELRNVLEKFSAHSPDFWGLKNA